MDQRGRGCANGKRLLKRKEKLDQVARKVKETAEKAVDKMKDAKHARHSGNPSMRKGP